MIYLNVWDNIYRYENAEDYRGDINPQIWVKYYLWNTLNSNLKDTYKMIKKVLKNIPFNDVKNNYQIMKTITHLFGSFMLFKDSDPWAHEWDKLGGWFYTDTTPHDFWEQLQIWLEAFNEWVED